MASLNDFFDDSLLQGLIVERLNKVKVLEAMPWSRLGLCAWKFQAFLSGPSIIVLVAFTSAWAMAPFALLWSWTTTVIYCLARKRGMTDSLEQKNQSIREKGFRIAIAGIEESAYTYMATRCLSSQKKNRVRKVRNVGIQAIAFVRYGVTVNHHLLSRNGRTGWSLTSLLLVSSCFHVALEIFIGATVKGVMFSMLSI